MLSLTDSDQQHLTKLAFYHYAKVKTLLFDAGVPNIHVQPEGEDGPALLQPDPLAQGQGRYRHLSKAQLPPLPGSQVPVLI